MLGLPAVSRDGDRVRARKPVHEAFRFSFFGLEREGRREGEGKRERDR